MTPETEEEKGITTKDIMAMNRKERRKIRKAVGIMFPGTTPPYINGKRKRK